MMSRRDFEAIAKVIAAGDGVTDYAARREVAKGLAAYFMQANPAFDTERFYAACKVIV